MGDVTTIARTTSDNIAAIEKALEGAKKEADHHYCKALDQLQKTPCLGADYKMGKGEFGKPEYEAHKVANTDLGHHFGMYRAIKLLEPSISALLAEARKAEAMEQEIAEKDARIAALEAGVSDLVEIARQGVPSIPPDGPTSPEHQAAYEATGFTLVEIRNRARTLLNGGSDAQG